MHDATGYCDTRKLPFREPTKEEQMLKRPMGMRLLITLALLCAVCSAASANPAPDPSAFQPVYVSGVDLSPLYTSSQLSYTVTLDSDAYLILNAVQYPITLIWGVFAVNKTGMAGNDIVANGVDIGNWSWDTKPAHDTSFVVAGWLNNSKNEAIATPSMGSVSKTFDYSQFEYNGLDPLFGLHVSVSVPEGAPMPFGTGLTGPIIVSVPEPSSILVVLTGVVGIGGLLRRRS